MAMLINSNKNNMVSYILVMNKIKCLINNNKATPKDDEYCIIILELFTITPYDMNQIPSGTTKILMLNIVFFLIILFHFML